MRKAFTLVEVLVVVTLLAIMATVVMPMISGGDSVRVPTIARMVMSDLLFVQNTAITHQRKTWVMFSADKQTYTVVASDTPPTSSPTREQALGVATYTQGTIIKQPTTSSGFYVTFGPGSSSPMDRATMAMTSDGANLSVFGYDALGTPIDSLGKELLAPVTILISNTGDGMVRKTLEITPLTGEITAK